MDMTSWPYVTSYSDTPRAPGAMQLEGLMPAPLKKASNGQKFRKSYQYPVLAMMKFHESLIILIHEGCAHTLIPPLLFTLCTYIYQSTEIYIHPDS